MGLKVTTGRIDEAEKRLGLELPPEVKARLQQENGGEDYAEGEDWELQPDSDPTDRKSTSRSANHIEVETRVARSWPGFPPAVVSVAVNASGGRLVVFPGTLTIESGDNETGALAAINLE